jgi:UDP-2,3-diacylglucosamine pyrophosphatase LpxH
VRLFEEEGPTKLAKQLGITTKSIYQRRASLEGRIGRQITGPDHPKQTRHGIAHPQRVTFNIQNGHVLIGSDAHIWPGPKSTAMRAFIKFCGDVKPDAVILNGDVMDFPQVSRHPPIGWENHPTVQQEIEAAQDILHEIELAAGKARKVWTLGNHDGRFETRLATVAPEFAKLNGIHLRDHFPQWEPGWSCWINNEVVVKHRFKGGVHAAHNNAVSSGKHMVTGHLHSAKVAPWTDYNGTRFAVDTGCLADPDHRAFVDYTEDNPKNWLSGFGLFTFHRGKLLPPELILVHDENSVAFRGEVIRV